jgi:hypothetical protein
MNWKLSLCTLALAVGCLIYTASVKTQAESLNKGITKLEESAAEADRKLKKFNLDEMEEKIEEIEKNLNSVRDILGISNNPPS